MSRQIIPLKARADSQGRSVGARNRGSTKPSRTPFRRPIPFQSSSRRRAGAPVVPDLMPVPSQNFMDLRSCGDFRPKGDRESFKFSQANEVLRRETGYHTCPLGAAVAAAHSPFPARHSVVAARRRRVAAERDNKRTLSNDQL